MSKRIEELMEILYANFKIKKFHIEFQDNKENWHDKMIKFWSQLTVSNPVQL